MKRLWILLATISGTIVSNSASPAGSAEAGAAKAAVCQACHGANGNSTNPEWPSLAGLGADYIADQLKNFKEGKRPNPVMMPNAMTLSADDMANLGAYFDGLVNTGLEADPSYWQAGQDPVPGRRSGARDSGVHGLPWSHRPRQRTGKISGAAWPTVGLRDETTE